MSTTNRLIELQAIVEAQVQVIVKKTDLYHILQVHLGYIQPYTLVPARGVIVKSVPKDWIGIPQIQAAFLAARLRLSDVQVRALMKSVKDFALFEFQNKNDSMQSKKVL